MNARKLKEIGQRANGSKLNVLDFGCGTGFVSRILTENHFPYQRLVCLDLSQEMLSFAKTKLSGAANVQYANNLNEIKDQTFDLITINSVLHHFHDPKKLLHTLQSYLKPGGQIVGGHAPIINFTYNIYNCKR